ncbi:hypothetical protein ABEB36_007612 [Hypothenemus hampei]|uniref:Spaetzle domain-containing protein n=1 Tax=Hypothenemus hampei TaxID=57062 RepID=A0ABD1EYJ2_HYPHA
MKSVNITKLCCFNVIILLHIDIASSGSISTRFRTDSALIIPERIDLISNFKSFILRHKPTSCRTDLTYCEDVDTYPYNHIKSVLLRRDMPKVFFGRDELPVDLTTKSRNEESYICKSIKKTIFPTMGQNIDNQWKYIINQGDRDGFVQGIQIEICQTPNRQCDYPGSLAMGYRTICKQKYAYRRLISLSNVGIPEADTFKIPSACCCSYERTFEFMNRRRGGEMRENF